MSNKFCVPTNNSLNKNRSVNISSNKENRQNSEMNNRVQVAQNNTFATPSEDGFDDDDDEFLIAASQQVERTLAQEKAEVTAKATGTLQLQGEIAILRDQNTRLSREKDKMHIKQLEDIRAQEMKFKRELDNLKSKLEFKDRDIEELKAKIQLDNTSRSESYHLAKRPRLSVVKETTRTAAPPATSQPTHTQFCIKNCRRSSSVTMSTFSNLNEISTDVETFYKGLRNNTELQKKFNIRSGDGKCTPSKEIVSRMENLFLQADILPSCHDKTICLKILSLLLTRNIYPNLEPEIKKLIAALQSATLAQHSILTETLKHSEYNILLLCARNKSSCQLNALYRHRSRHVIDMLINAVLQVADTIHYCSCSNKMVMYTCDVIRDSVSGDLLSTTLEINNRSLLLQCLQLLSSLSPYLADMRVNSTTQTVFFGALDILKKCPSLSAPGQAMVDLLYEAIFDANSSMSN